MSACKQCGKDAPECHNYCSTECTIQAYRGAGAVEHLPNGLPIRCMSRDFLLECEHGDHINYICPVAAEYTGDIEEVTTRNAEGKEIYVHDRETHALIYTDGAVAVTMYECCYAMWYVHNGSLGGGFLWKTSEWKLTQESLVEIRKRASARSIITKREEPCPICGRIRD